MATRIDHLGVAVRDLAQAERLFGVLLGGESAGRESVTSEGVNVSFFQVGESRIELLEPQGPDTNLQRSLDKRGEGVHHVCLAVEDIDAEVARLKEAGFTFVGDAPRPGAGGCRVAFIHPKSAGGILVELSQGSHGG